MINHPWVFALGLLALVQGETGFRVPSTELPLWFYLLEAAVGTFAIGMSIRKVT